MLFNIHIIDQPQVFFAAFSTTNLLTFFSVQSIHINRYTIFFMGIITYIINMLSYPFDFIEHGFYDQIYIT